MKRLFKKNTGGKFNKGPQNHAAQKQKERIFPKLRQENSENHCARSIDWAQWTAYESSVDKFLFAGSCYTDLRTPAG